MAGTTQSPEIQFPPLQLDVTSDPANLAGVRHAVEKFSGSVGFDEKATGEIGLCINEAMANVTRHAYGGAIDRPVQIRAELTDGALLVTVRDWGPGTTPPAHHSHEPLKPGGLGLLCLQRLMDDVTFKRLPDGMLVSLKRKLPNQRAS